MFFCSLLFQICQKLLKIFEQVNFFPLTIFAYNFLFLKKRGRRFSRTILLYSKFFSITFLFLHFYSPLFAQLFQSSKHELLRLPINFTTSSYRRRLYYPSRRVEERQNSSSTACKQTPRSFLRDYLHGAFLPFFFFFLSLFFRVLFRDSSSTAIWSDRRSLLEEGTKVGGDRERKRGKRRVGGPHVLPLFPFFFNARAKGALLSRSHEKPPPLSWPPFCFSARGPDRSLALSSLSSDRSWLLKPLSPLAWRISILPLDACRMSPVY